MCWFLCAGVGLDVDRKANTIKGDISRLFLVISAVISVSITSITYYSISTSIEKHTIDDLQTMSKAKAELIESELQHEVDIASHITSSINLRKYMQDLQKHWEDSNYIKLITTDLEKEVRASTKPSVDIMWVDIYDTNSQLVSAINIQDEEMIEHEYGLKDFFGIKEPLVGMFYLNNGKIFHNIYVPIFHPNRNFQIIGYAVFASSCSCSINGFDSSLNLGASGEFIIAKKDGVNAIVLSTLRKTTTKPLSLKFPMDSPQAQILRQAFDGNAGNLTAIDYRGKEVFAAYRYISAYDIAVVAKIDSSEVLSELNQCFTKIIVIIIIAVFIAYYFVTRKLERSLLSVHELEHGARRFASGDLGYRIPILGNTELSRLTRVFNNMAEKLDQATSSKEDLNAQVQKQLEVEQQLNAERAKLEAIFESTDDCIMVWDRDYIHIYINQAAAKAIGLSKRNILGKTIAEVYDSRPEFAKHWKDRIDRVFTDGEILKVNDKFEINGEMVFSESVISPIVNDHDEVFAVGVIYRDVTNRKYAEDSAYASWQMLQQILNSVPVRIFWKDVKGTYLGSNMNFAIDAGFHNPEDIMGKTDEDMVWSTYAETYRADDKSVVETGNSLLEFEEKLIGIDGQEMVIKTSKVPLLRSDGSTYGILGCYEDITERHEFVEKLKNAQREAELANKAKSDFLASMSHEIRTPINAIIGMADVLLNSNVTSEHKEYVRILKSAGENLSHLVGNILDFTKLEAGKLEHNNCEFSLGDVLSDTVNLVTLKTHEKNLYLNLHVDDEVQLQLYGDSGKLRQILLNLLNNAAKFTYGGGVDLRVSEWHEALPGKYTLLFEVKDTGRGIPKDRLDSIFDRFVQVIEFEGQVGTGLGLSICKDLSQMLDGDIWVESDIDEGSKFSFTATFKPLDAIKNGRYHSSNKRSLRGTNAQIICDNKDLTEQMQHTLKEWKVNNSHFSELSDDVFAEDSDFIILMPGEAMAAAIIERYTKIEKQKDKELDKTLGKMILIHQNLNADVMEKIVDIGINYKLIQPVIRKELYKCLNTIYELNGNISTVIGKETKFSWYDPAKINILIAEDDPITKKVMRLAFQNLGYRLDIASSGVEVLELLKKDTYDIIFMDTNMPDLDGNETTKKIRELEISSDSRIPIVAVTARVFDDDRKEAFDSGIDWFLPKPIIVEQMVEAINKLVKLD